MSSPTPQPTTNHVSTPKLKPKTNAGTRGLPLHIRNELRSIWSADPRMPTQASRRAWASLRNQDIAKINIWFYGRKAAAKKSGKPISEDTYNLPLNSPPPTPVPSVGVKTEQVDDSDHLPLKKIKVEAHDTAISGRFSSPATSTVPSSDDTLVASETDPPSSASNFAKNSRKRAYSHSSDILVSSLPSTPLVNRNFLASLAPRDDVPSNNKLPALDQPSLSSANHSRARSVSLSTTNNQNEDAQADDDSFIRDPTLEQICNQNSDSPSDSDFTCPLCRFSGICLRQKSHFD